MTARPIDTHCHLTHRRFETDAAAVVARAREAGLAACVTIGTGVADARRCREMAARYPGFVHASAGIDPFTAHDLGDGFEEALAELACLLEAGGFCALGEVGLDYHYELASKATQASHLAAQLDLAARLDLPVVIHVREAHDDMVQILSRHGRNRGVIHSFTGDVAQAEAYLELGWSLAYNGVATFANASEVRRAASITPVDRLLVETDSPYLAPVPQRGRRCEPAYVVHTLEKLAEIRGDGIDDLAETTSRNARRLFGLEESACGSG